MIKLKKKICKNCNLETYLFSKGLCNNCYKKESMANKRSVKQDTKSSKKLLKKKKEVLRSIPDLKRELWYWTSLACRLRDADSEGNIECPVCKAVTSTYFKGVMQAGHFVRKSRGGVTEYMLDNLVSICSGCNIEDSDYKLSKVVNERNQSINGELFTDYLFRINKDQSIKKDRIFYDTEIPKTKRLVLQLSKDKNLWDWSINCLVKYKKSYGINIIQ